MGLGSRANRLSRPTRAGRTTPAPSRTRRCLVTACRVSRVPDVRREIDCGSPVVSLASNPRRVSSPRAAKTDALVLKAAALLRLMFDMPRDVLDLGRPAAFVHAEGLVAAVRRQLVEARFDDAQPRAGCRLLPGEFDQRRAVAVVVLLGIDGIGVPGEGEQPLGLHLLHHSLPGNVLVTGM